MASPSSVLTRGLGSWGSVNLLPTLGYGIGAAAAVIVGPCWAAGEVYEPGFQELDVYHPGFQEAEREC